MKQFVMLRSVALVGLALAMVGCMDFTPNVPKEQACRILDAWLAQPPSFQGPNRFKKGQQQQVTVNKVFAYGYASDVSYAELTFTDFHYQSNGVAKTYTGEAGLDFRKLPDGQWTISCLILQNEPGSIRTEFKPVRKTGG